MAIPSRVAIVLRWQVCGCHSNSLYESNVLRTTTCVGHTIISSVIDLYNDE